MPADKLLLPNLADFETILMCLSSVPPTSSIPPLPEDVVKSVQIKRPNDSRTFLILGCRIQDDDKLWIHTQFVIQACTIVTGRKGCLKRRGSSEEVTSELLDAGRYDFHSNDGDTDYSVNASFDAWTPPAKYSDLPELWTCFKYYEEMDIQPPGCPSVDKLTDWAKQMDGRCAVTHSVANLQCAHIIPQECAQWADHHEIVDRAGPLEIAIPSYVTTSVQDVRNIMMLETGVLTWFDSPMFVFFPIKDTSGEVVPVLYYFKHEPVGIPYLYHMRVADLPKRIHPYFLYCRFAWAIFRSVLAGGIVGAEGKSVQRKRPVRKGKKQEEEEEPPKKKNKTKPGPKDADSKEEFAATPGGAMEEDYGENSTATSSVSLPSNAFVYGSMDFKSPAEGLAVLAAREARIGPSARKIFEASEGFPDVVSEYEDSYPGISDIARLKLDYVRKNPSVISTTDPHTERYETDVFLSKGISGS